MNSWITPCGIRSSGQMVWPKQWSASPEGGAKRGTYVLIFTRSSSFSWVPSPLLPTKQALPIVYIIHELVVASGHRLPSPLYPTIERELSLAEIYSLGYPVNNRCFSPSLLWPAVACGDGCSYPVFFGYCSMTAVYFRALILLVLLNP